MLERIRTPLTVWFEAAWLMVADKPGVSTTHLHRILPIASYQTAWTLPAKLRSVMGITDTELWSGRVEVDETFFGGPRPGVRVRVAVGKTLVAGAIESGEHGWGRARLTVIDDASAATLQTFAEANIAARPTVVTDAWSAYPPALYLGQTRDRGHLSRRRECGASVGVLGRVRLPVQSQTQPLARIGVHAFTPTGRGQ